MSVINCAECSLPIDTDTEEVYGAIKGDICRNCRDEKLAGNHSPLKSAFLEKDRDADKPDELDYARNVGSNPTASGTNICANCGREINVPETALKLCDKCFNEICICGHKRAIHAGDDCSGSCIHAFNLNHKTKRGQFCPCEKFERDLNKPGRQK